MSEFLGKTILITGASRGVGRQTALDFGNLGANVCVNYAKSTEEAENVVKQIQASGGKAVAYQADISDSSKVNGMLEGISEHFGTVDVLVNSAGVSVDGPFLEMTEEAWDYVHSVNLKGAFLVLQAVARQMMKGNGGVIVNISSCTSTTGRVEGANYCSSKAGLNMLTKCMAVELGPMIRVNGLGLGFVDSQLVREVFTEDQITHAVENTPLKRMTSYQETSAFIRLLASESTSFVTGQTIMFDGGTVMR